MKHRHPSTRRNSNSTQYITLNTGKCQACWKCIEVCSNGVIGKINIVFHKHARIDHAERCKGCQKCVKACPEQAIIAYHIKKQNN